MSKSSANAEPSMEEILASIRQIISDDGPEAAAEDEDSGDDLELESAADETISEADLDALFADPAPAEAEDEAGDEDVSADLDDGFASVAADPEPEPDDMEMAVEADDEDESLTMDEDEDVLDLGDLPEMAEEPFDPPEDLDFADQVPEPEPEDEPVAFTPPPEPQPVVHDPMPAASRLLSQEADSAVSAAFANLANTMLSGNARTLEDLVQDMLRPMLKSWLDENLPTMVEKMVREEIERVARRGPRP
jgi:cell pole-organizing protein PopZ